MSARVLVTGSTGFTGNYVCDALAEAGWNVWGLARKPPAQSHRNHVQANLTDPASLRKAIELASPDAVIHLAAVAFVSHHDPGAFYSANLMGTRNLLEALAETGFGRSGVVLASSANVYGKGWDRPIAETLPAAPVNDYAISKLAMEHVARLFDDRLPISIVRPFNYTGRNQDKRFLVPKIVSHFARRAPVIELGNTDIARDFSDVRDVARDYVALLAGAGRRETINICSGVATSLETILEQCEAITGHGIERRVNPALKRSNEIRMLVGDPSKAETILGDRPRIPISDTLRWMLETPA